MSWFSAGFKRHQTRGEELANSISHGLGLLTAIGATPLLLARAGRDGDALFMVGTSIFAATVILLYLASTLYHALQQGKSKRIFQMIEHSAIYFLIAGTYTPFMLGALRGPWGWSLLGLIWGLAAVGIVSTIIGKASHPIFTTSLYLAMGWLIVSAAKPFFDQVPTAGLVWLLAGGLAYTLGVIFFATDSRLRYGHLIWHLFVLLGTLCHFVAIIGYAA
jgi:hemolysin III